MSWLSSIGDSIGNFAKKTVSGIGKAAGLVGGVLKKVATPALSFAAGLVPGVGPILSQVVDAVGNKLLGDSGDATQAADAVEQTPVADFVAQSAGQVIGLGNSTGAQALANATMQDAEAKGFLGIGDGKPGILGIGDGKPGILGIGTGKNKIRKQAEDAARGEGLSPAAIKLAGEQAVAGIPATVKGTGASSSDKPGGAGSASLAIPLIGGILALLFAL